MRGKTKAEGEMDRQLRVMFSLQAISGGVGEGVWGSAVADPVLRSSKLEVYIVLENPLFIPSGILLQCFTPTVDKRFHS